MRSTRRPRTIGAGVAVAIVAAAALVTLPGGAATAATYTVPVEDEGAQCPAVTLPDSVASNTKLPDPFKRLDGSRITTKGDWICQRELTERLAEKFVYGAKPAKPSSVTGTVSRTGITVNVSDAGRSTSFTATVDLPSGNGPFPAVIVYGGFGADTATIKASGAAVVSYDPYQVGKEGTGRTNKQGAFYSLYGSNSQTGLLMAWAWGVSRLVDVIQSSGGSILSPTTGVTGCSRFGKGAFVAGAFDQRIALTMPIESGSAGVPIFRGIPGEGAQSLSSAYTEQPWLGDAFGAFTGNPSALPIDTHQVVGLVAPRGLFVMDNPTIANLGPRSASVAAQAGAQVYQALGAGDNITYWSDIANGTHCAIRPEWKTPLQQNIAKFLTGTGNAAGTIRIASSAKGNLADWVDWTTPTLAGVTTPPPTTPVVTTPPVTPPPTSPPVTPPPTTPPVTRPPTTPPPAGGGCTASVSLNQWDGGFVATVKVTAGSSAISRWTVNLTLPSGATITNAWNANRSGSTGAVQLTNAAYNGSVPAGQSTELGFQATGSGTGTTATCSAS